MSVSTFNRRSEIACSVEELFAWHERAGAFERLNPPWEPVTVLERQGGIRDGAQVTIRVPLGPFGVRWTLVHEGYQPPHQFRDVQLKGPFRRYAHTHRFESLGPTRAALHDQIEYQLPLGPLGELFGGTITRRKIEAAFRYRHRLTSDDLTAHQRFRDYPRMSVLVSGSTGLVGAALVPYLTTAGHRVQRLVRASATRSPGEISWDPNTRVQFPTLTGIDAVVHLAGAPIAEGRWTSARKREIRESRVRGTTTLCESLLSLTPRPKVLVCASAIGIYGSRGDELLTEESTRGTGFLSDVSAEWEQAAEIARAAGIRVVNLRIGIVLSPQGGALKKMLLPFSLGLGGRLGSGNQWMSWIALDDLLGLIEHALCSPDVAGPLNAVAPTPVTNRDFTQTLARVLRRPALFPAPQFALRVALGELADEALLSSIRVSPHAALKGGYPFRFSELEDALRYMLGR